MRPSPLPISSVQFSRSVVSDSLWPHELQHARPPCLSPTPGVYSNSCPLSWWCHPTISSSVVPFSSCLQSFPTSRSFPMRRPLCSGWPKYWSFSFSINPSNEYSGLIFFRIEPTENWGRTMCNSCGYVFWDYILEARIKQEQQKERNSVVLYYIIYLIFNLVFFLSGVTPFLLGRTLLFQTMP